MKVSVFIGRKIHLFFNLWINGYFYLFLHLFMEPWSCLSFKSFIFLKKDFNIFQEQFVFDLKSNNSCFYLLNKFDHFRFYGLLVEWLMFFPDYWSIIRVKLCWLISDWLPLNLICGARGPSGPSFGWCKHVSAWCLLNLHLQDGNPFWPSGWERRLQ